MKTLAQILACSVLFLILGLSSSAQANTNIETLESEFLANSNELADSSWPQLIGNVRNHRDNMGVSSSDVRTARRNVETQLTAQQVMVENAIVLAEEGEEETAQLLGTMIETLSQNSVWAAQSLFNEVNGIGQLAGYGPAAREFESFLDETCSQLAQIKALLESTHVDFTPQTLSVVQDSSNDLTELENSQQANRSRTQIEYEEARDLFEEVGQSSHIPEMMEIVTDARTEKLQAHLRFRHARHAHREIRFASHLVNEISDRIERRSEEFLVEVQTNSTVSTVENELAYTPAEIRNEPEATTLGVESPTAGGEESEDLVAETTTLGAITGASANDSEDEIILPLTNDPIGMGLANPVDVDSGAMDGLDSTQENVATVAQEVQQEEPQTRGPPEENNPTVLTAENSQDQQTSNQDSTGPVIPYDLILVGALILLLILLCIGMVVVLIIRVRKTKKLKDYSLEQSKLIKRLQGENNQLLEVVSKLERRKEGLKREIADIKESSARLTKHSLVENKRLEEEIEELKKIVGQVQKTDVGQLLVENQKLTEQNDSLIIDCEIFEQQSVQLVNQLKNMSNERTSAVNHANILIDALLNRDDQIDRLERENKALRDSLWIQAQRADNAEAAAEGIGLEHLETHQDDHPRVPQLAMRPSFRDDKEDFIPPSWEELGNRDDPVPNPDIEGDSDSVRDTTTADWLAVSLSASDEHKDGDLHSILDDGRLLSWLHVYLKKPLVSAILNLAPAEEIKTALDQGDTDFLMKANGVGTKTANMLILAWQETKEFAESKNIHPTHH